MKTAAFPKSSVKGRKLDELRYKNDWVSRSVNIIAAIGWVFVLMSLTLIDCAKPETENFFTRILNLHVRSYWNFELLRVSFGVLAVSFIACAIGFIVNMSMRHRKADRYNKAIIALGAVIFVLTIAITAKLS